MKWFKHDADASNDTRIKKLKNKFGMEGYGIYFNTLEIIARKMEDNIKDFGFIPEDWDEESLELEFGKDTNTIRTMFDYMCEIGLFKKIDGRIYNSKIQSRCDDYTSRILRNKAQNEKCPNIVRTMSDKVSLDKNRIDKIREDKIHFDIFWNAYQKKIDRPKCEKKWKNLTLAEQTAIMEYIPKYLATIKDKQFQRHPATFLNNRSWENEIDNAPKYKPNEVKYKPNGMRIYDPMNIASWSDMKITEDFGVAGLKKYRGDDFKF